MSNTLSPLFLNQLISQGQEADRPKALLILSFIEQKGSAALQAIKAETGVSAVHQYLKNYIQSGFVMVDKRSPREIYYSLSAGLSATDIYSGKALKDKKTQENSEKNTMTIEMSIEDSVPTFKAGVKKRQADLATAKPPHHKTSSNFRCAYTNDGCLILFGLNEYLPVELNASQTNDLIDFISEQITPIGVSI